MTRVAEIKNILRDQERALVELQFEYPFAVSHKICVPASRVSEAIGKGESLKLVLPHSSPKFGKNVVRLQPDLETFEPSHFSHSEEGTLPVARLMCDVVAPDGTTHDKSYRYVLERVLTEASELQLEPNLKATIHPNIALPSEPLPSENVLTTCDRLVSRGIPQRGTWRCWSVNPPGEGDMCWEIVLVSTGDQFRPEWRFAFFSGLLHHANALAAVAMPAFGPNRGGDGVADGPSFMHFYDEGTDSNGIGRYRFPTVSTATNPYLVSASMLRAGFDGIQRGLKAPDESNVVREESQSNHEFRYAVSSVPGDFTKRLEAFARDELLRETLGEAAHLHFVQTAQRNWNDATRDFIPAVDGVVDGSKSSLTVEGGERCKSS